MTFNHSNTTGPINPASGFVMMNDDCSGVDVAGNPYGTSTVDPFGGASLFGDTPAGTTFAHDDSYASSSWDP